MVAAYLLELAIGVREGGVAGNDEPWEDGGRWMVLRFEETGYSHHAVTQSQGRSVHVLFNSAQLPHRFLADALNRPYFPRCLPKPALKRPRLLLAEKRSWAA